MDPKLQLKIIYWASKFLNVNIQKYIAEEKCSLQVEIIISKCVTIIYSTSFQMYPISTTFLTSESISPL